MKRILLFILLIISAILLPAQSIQFLIKKAGDAKKFSGYDYITVFDSTYTYMEENGLSRVKMHKLIKMLTNIGCKENSTVKIDYDPLSAYVEINKITVYRHDGTTKVIDNPILDYVAPARMIYWNASQKMVEIGHLEPGDAIEIEMSRKGFTYALLQGDGDDDSKYIPPMRGHFYDIVEFWSNQPIIKKVYIANILKNKNLQYRVYNGEINSSVLSNGDRMLYTFEKDNIMPIRMPSYSVAQSDVLTKLLLSTSPDWFTKSKWFYGVNEDYGSFKPTPELQNKVTELLKPAKNELDSISILTHWVADNMRYSGLTMGKGEGFTLHPAGMNFTDRCGVCKDKASLLISMLRAAGFKAYPAMTMAGSRIDRIPADQFNHCVTVIQRHNGKYQLLDPTWVPNLRELWSSAEQQQNYLMGIPEGADLMETPISPSSNHYVHINGKSEIKSDGTLVGEFSITAEGQSDAAVRSIFRNRYSDWDNAVRSELFHVDPRAIITSITYTNSDKYLEQPVLITYKYKIPNFAIITDNEILFTPLLAKGVFNRAMPEVYYDTTLNSREYPFKDRCSRLVEIKETITLPKYSKVINIPKERNVKAENINYSGKYSINNKTLTFIQTADFGKRIYDADEWPFYRNAVKNQLDFSKQYVILHK